MAQDGTELMAARVKPLHDLAAKIKLLEPFASRGIKGRDEEVRKIAREISDCANAARESYGERGDSILQFLKLIENTFGNNKPASYVRVSTYTAKEVLRVAGMIDVTMAQVHGVSETLKGMGVSADYLK